MTTPQQIQATKDTYGHQIAPPPGDSPFYGTLVHDAAGPTGVTMHQQRHFTEAHLLAYHPLHSMFDTHTKQRVIAAHHNLRHLFQPTPTHSALRWPWRLKSPTTTHDKVPQLLLHIRSITGSARHDFFYSKCLRAITAPIDTPRPTFDITLPCTPDPSAGNQKPHKGSHP